MIDKIILRNFQSHAHTEVEFSHGINSIIGESNNGKTSIQRGFEWVRTNRPVGLAFASHWVTELGKNEKLYLIDTVAVTVVFSEGKYVTRERRKGDYNGYIIGDYVNGEFIPVEEFTKVGTDVPAKVAMLFNMDTVNVQNQHDRMFLLSDNGPDVARFFNKLIKLDDSDSAMHIIRTKKRLAKTAYDAATMEVSELDKKLHALSWVTPALEQSERISMTEKNLTKVNSELDELDTIIDNMESIAPYCSLPEYLEAAMMTMERIDIFSEKIELMDDNIYDLSVLIHDITEIKEELSATLWIADAEVLLSEIDRIDTSIDEYTTEIDSIDSIISSMEDNSKKMDSVAYIPAAKEVLASIEKYDDTILSISESIDEIEMLIMKMESCEQQIHRGNVSKKDLIKQLPDLCPTCGSVLKKGESNEVHTHR